MRMVEGQTLPNHPSKEPENQPSGVERAELLSTWRIYDAAGTRKREEFAPLHRLELTSDLKSDTTTLVPAGTSVIGRSWAVNTYDEGRPMDGTATVKDQVTRTITGVQVREHLSIHGEQRTTQTVYDWVIAPPVKSIQDPDGLALTSVTKYDSQGRVRKEIPPAATGTDAATRVATYWSASGSGACAGRPEWADLLCSTGPASTVTGGGSNPAELVTSTTEDNWWGSTATVKETANGVTRTTTTSYDGGGRPVKSTVTGGLGAALPEVTTEYSQDSGRPVKTVSTTGGTITRLFDKLGRQISYIDADGGVATVEFDKLDRPVKVADSVPSTTTYTYDDAAEPRGLATSFTDSVAGVFRTSYDAFVSRRGGGVAKNGYRYMGLLHQRPGHGLRKPLPRVLQRHLRGDAGNASGQARQDAQAPVKGQLDVSG